MAINVAAVKSDLAALEETVSHFRTTEAEKSLSVAIRHLIRPVAAIRLRIEGQTFRTIEHVAATVDAIHELAAMLMIADLEVAVLMWAIIGRKCRL